MKTTDVRTGAEYVILSAIKQAADGHYIAEGKGKDDKIYLLEWWLPYVPEGYEWSDCDKARLIE